MGLEVDSYTFPFRPASTSVELSLALYVLRVVSRDGHQEESDLIFILLNRFYMSFVFKEKQFRGI